MQYKVNAPNKEYTGVIAGVSFVKGEAYTEDTWAASWFEGKGYKVEEINEQEEKPREPNSNLQYLKVDELKAMAKVRGIENYASMKKDELIEALGKGDE